jgi:hypothetical protein
MNMSIFPALLALQRCSCRLLICKPPPANCNYNCLAQRCQWEIYGKTYGADRVVNTLQTSQHPVLCDDSQSWQIALN